MGFVIFIAIVLYIIFKILTYKDGEKRNYNESTIKSSTKINSNTRTTDKWIIDIVGESSRDIETKNSVPYWTHQYIYSYSDLEGVTPTQKTFYDHFKNDFLKGEYIDLQGNLNYAFILLFDLLNQFDNHNDIDKLERQLEVLGLHYPRTKSYCISFLVKRMESIGYDEGVLRIVENNPHDIYGYDYWKTGNRYKTKLKLNNEEVEILNKLWYPSNNFCDIEYCKIEIIKLYLALFKSLEEDYTNVGNSITNAFNDVADIFIKKQYGYRKGSANYKYNLESTLQNLYQNIFKFCENEVRELYGHKRKLNTDLSSLPDVNAEFENKILSVVIKLLPQLVHTIVQLPDEATNIELYGKNATRWKEKYKFITENYSDNPEKFYEEICYLGKLNKNNPSIENIFFEASKYISKKDSEKALVLYIHYLYHDLRSASFDNKQLTKTVQKSLFKTEEQINEFKEIAEEFIKNRDLNKAINAVVGIYAPKRRKIEIDRSVIKEVQEQSTETVELLNEYLQDERGDITITINDNIEIEIPYTHIPNNIYSANLSLTPIQFEILNFFSKNSLSVSVEDFDIYSTENNLFKNQLIDSINEICFDLLDDILIEEEEDFYTINENYYNNILEK